jgi:hypothetical protein
MKNKEPYLKIPAQILNITQIGLCEKALLAHIYSFDVKGCWQSNQTLAEIFMVSAPTIRRWLGRIRPYTCVKNPKGYYRTIWAKSVLKNDQGPAQNGTPDLVKSEHRVDQNRSTTINNTITENNERTIASPTPLSAFGRTSATLGCRRCVTAEQMEKFKARLGRPAVWTPLTPEQFGRRRAEQLAALRATKDNR